MRKHVALVATSTGSNNCPWAVSCLRAVNGNKYCLVNVKIKKKKQVNIAVVGLSERTLNTRRIVFSERIRFRQLYELHINGWLTMRHLRVLQQYEFQGRVAYWHWTNCALIAHNSHPVIASISTQLTGSPRISFFTVQNSTRETVSTPPHAKWILLIIAKFRHR